MLPPPVKEEEAPGGPVAAATFHAQGGQGALGQPAAVSVAPQQAPQQQAPQQPPQQPVAPPSQAPQLQLAQPLAPQQAPQQPQPPAAAGPPQPIVPALMNLPPAAAAADATHDEAAAGAVTDEEEDPRETRNRRLRGIRRSRPRQRKFRQGLLYKTFAHLGIPAELQLAWPVDWDNINMLSRTVCGYSWECSTVPWQTLSPITRCIGRRATSLATL